MMPSSAGDSPTHLELVRRLHFPLLSQTQSPVKEFTMLSWALVFLVFALIAGVFGFTGLAGVSSQIAWIIFVVFIILFVLSLAMGRRVPPAA
jgi:uncharacterized membrane protein YtjA (UPF0391 family)